MKKSFAICAVGLFAAFSAFAIEEKPQSFVMDDLGGIFTVGPDYKPGRDDVNASVIPMNETVADVITGMIPKPSTGISNKSVTCLTKFQTVSTPILQAAVYSVRDCH